MDLGSTIKDIRKQKGLTQVAFASLCGITQTYLSQIEGNLKDPNLSTLKRISEELSVPLPILFFLSMTEEDVAPNKKSAFVQISPSIKSLINELFTVQKNELKKLAAIVDSTPEEIERITSNIDSYYREWTEKKKDKTGDYKRYKDGTIKQRVVRPSLKELKTIQKKIKSRILESIRLPNCVHGGVRRRSNITNAKPHQGKKYKFTTDLKDFYPSISSKMVYDTFLEQGFSPHYSRWLTKLTTWKYEVPQGAPTSTHIANLVFLKTDIKLIDICNKHGITYTRYIDDLTFSSQQDFEPIINDLLNAILLNDFKLSYRKTKYDGKQTVTGIEIFSNRIDVPEKIIEKAIAEIDSGEGPKPYTNYLNRVRKTNSKKQTITTKN